MTETNTPAYKVVVAFDFSELAERAFFEALSQTQRRSHVEVHVLCVGAYEGSMLRIPGAEDVLEQDAASELVRQRIAQLVDVHQRESGQVPVEKIAVYVAAGHPAERIVALATAIEASLVILGTHSRSGVSRMLLGSVAEAVVRRAPCGVLVLRPRDFFQGHRLPAVEPPLKAGEHPLPHFEHHPVYHYVSRVADTASRVMPVG